MPLCTYLRKEPLFVHLMKHLRCSITSCLLYPSLLHHLFSFRLLRDLSPRLVYRIAAQVLWHPDRLVSIVHLVSLAPHHCPSDRLWQPPPRVLLDPLHLYLIFTGHL